MIPVRTVPPYVRSVDRDDEDTVVPNDNRKSSDHSPKLLPVHIPGFRRSSQPGHKFDHLRSRTPPIITTPVLEYGSRWASFASPETGGPLRRKITEAEAERARAIYAEYDRQREADEEEGALKEGSRESRKRSFVDKSKRFILKNPFMPLIFRLIVLSFSVCALGMSGSIFERLSHDDNNCEKGASTYMALIVDAIAIPYILYITVDEYRSPPIGIRPSGEKFRLTLLDLIFIVFDAANLSLAFQALTDPEWICREGGQCKQQERICDLQKALAGLLLIALVAWISTFVVSLVRLMHKVVDR